ncbi:hypothetical protein HDV00_002495 [Rhizophlyctis rosea]|nr:hypothetical protein HDV00_002495 [Rhizophlyctis rosea]
MSTIDPPTSDHPTTSPSPSQDSDTPKIAAGIVSLIAPAIQEMDIRVVAVRASQAELHAEIERLSAELQLLLSTADPPALEAAITRLITARKRLTTAAATLKIIQERLERVHSAAVARAVGYTH